jgi:RNA polymerase sigma-70 factor (ECF subfamily)
MAATAGFEAWYRAEHRHVVTVLLAVVEDVAAEAFARALAKWDKVGAMERPTAWVYRVAVNLARRRARRLAVEQRLFGARTAAERREHQAAETWDAVGALPPRQRLAVVLRYVDDLTEADVAAAMGVSPGTVAATLHAARQRLAEMWRSE